MLATRSKHRISNSVLWCFNFNVLFYAGRFGPINSELSSQDWGFHVMMIFCYLFTNIVMMNVLISLFSMTFIRGDDCWRLTWIECRLRYIESAENMSYYIEGFRDTHDCFPKEIYHTADPLKMAAFHEKNHKIKPGMAFQGLFPKKDEQPHKRNNSSVDDKSQNNNNNNKLKAILQIENARLNAKQYQVNRETKADLSAIVATLAGMQRSIQDMHELEQEREREREHGREHEREREPLTKRDPRAAAAYVRAQARDLMEHWISGQQQGEQQPQFQQQQQDERADQRQKVSDGDEAANKHSFGAT